MTVKIPGWLIALALPITFGGCREKPKNLDRYEGGGPSESFLFALDSIERDLPSEIRRGVT
jgi:hypothetical protein